MEDGLTKEPALEENDEEFFRVGNVVAGVEFTTTEKALGIESLAEDVKEKKVIAVGPRTCALRSIVNGENLAWRQLDLYKISQMDEEDYSLEVLEAMMRREIEAYVHLRSVWGVRIPKLVYFGQDMSHLWVFVMSYEGKSLDCLFRDQRGLRRSVKNKAHESLKQLHQLGVLHGDADLRNAVLRDDGAVLWVGFQNSIVWSDKFANKSIFTQRCQQELRDLEKELQDIPTSDENEAGTTESNAFSERRRSKNVL